MFVFYDVTTIPDGALGTAGGGVLKALPDFMEDQEQSNWCWAANGASVGNFYHGSRTYTQCEVAKSCLQKPTCCSDPNGCNVYGFLDKALNATNSYDYMLNNSISFQDIVNRIDDESPVGTRVLWGTGNSGAHFNMITGYDTNEEKIVIQDPFYRTTTIRFSKYPSEYHGGGTWTHTYFTRKI